MKNLKFAKGLLLATALISILAGCDKGAHPVNSTESAGATPPRPDLLTICPVTGDPLGSMGTPYVIVYQGQKVKFCCASCTNAFFKDPDKYLKMIRALNKTSRE